MEAEAAAKRARRAADAAFLEMLRRVDPPVQVGTTFAAIEQQLSGEAAWQNVQEEGRKQELFSAYMEALAQVEAARINKAEKELKSLLVRLNVGPESSFEEVGCEGCALGWQGKGFPGAGLCSYLG